LAVSEALPGIEPRINSLASGAETGGKLQTIIEFAEIKKGDAASQHRPELSE